MLLVKEVRYESLVTMNFLIGDLGAGASMFN